MVSEWLKKFPNLNFFNRDGAQSFAKAINLAHPNSLQISDYFHFLRNLTEYLKEHIVKKIPSKIKIAGMVVKNKITLDSPLLKKRDKFSNEYEFSLAVKELYDSGNSISSICTLFAIQYRTFKKCLKIVEENIISPQKKTKEQKQEEKMRRKQNLINKTKKFYQQGLSRAEISRLLNLDFNTVTSYLTGKTTANFKRRSLPNEIDQYKEFLITQLTERKSFKEIYFSLKSLGYTKAERTLRHHISNFKKDLLQNKENLILKEPAIYLCRSKIISLLYKPIEKIIELNEETLIKVYELYPWLINLLQLLKDFKNMVTNSQASRIHDWMEQCKSSNIPELKSFLNSLTRDFSAITNAICFRTTNGLAEGSVNKLKNLKRVMYGRASFETLRKKLLWYERNM